jgi:hypothetical protein
MVELALAIIVASLPGLKILLLRDTRGSKRGSIGTTELEEDNKSSELVKAQEAVTKQV